MLALLVVMSDKQGFIDMMGGPEVPMGSSGLTAQQLADRIELALQDLTSPGYRVYRPEGNRDRFWDKLVEG